MPFVCWFVLIKGVYILFIILGVLYIWFFMINELFDEFSIIFRWWYTVSTWKSKLKSASFMNTCRNLSFWILLCKLKRHPVVVCALFSFVKYVKLIYSSGHICPHSPYWGLIKGHTVSWSTKSIYLRTWQGSTNIFLSSQHSAMSYICQQNNTNDITVNFFHSNNNKKDLSLITPTQQ